MKILSFTFAIVIILIVSSCNQNKKSIVATTPELMNDYFVNSVLYNYYAAEYKALCYQAYNSARDYAELLKLKNPRKKDMAIILDIDETVLDNSPYQARLFEINATYDSLWNYWCNLSEARPIPGSVDFLNFADSLGYNIFYISNRKMITYEGTLNNLKKAGFPQADSSHLLLRLKENDKENRRKTVSEKYEIVMLVGDNLGDFYSDTEEYLKRDSLMMSQRAAFGKKLIVLPNSIYGNWINSIKFSDKTNLDSLVSKMTIPFKKS